MSLDLLLREHVLGLQDGLTPFDGLCPGFREPFTQALTHAYERTKS